MENQAQTVAAMPAQLTGYQWGDRGTFIGSYTFDNNGDQDKVHLPPRTTLIEPPAVAVDEEAVWEAARGRWITRRIEMAHLVAREVPNVG